MTTQIFFFVCFFFFFVCVCDWRPLGWLCLVGVEWWHTDRDDGAPVETSPTAVVVKSAWRDFFFNQIDSSLIDRHGRSADDSQHWH